MFKNNRLHNTRGVQTLCAALLATCIAAPQVAAQKGGASPRERAGATVFGERCSVCHGVRLVQADATLNLAAATQTMSEADFIAAAKIARGAMPSFASLLPDKALADVYAYIKRGHTSDLDNVPMESGH